MQTVDFAGKGEELRAERPVRCSDFGVEYGEDIDKVKAVLQQIINADTRILDDPAPLIALKALSASSVDVIVRAWTKTSDYWDVYFDINKKVYDTFNREGIGFPFPQLTIHQSTD